MAQRRKGGGGRRRDSGPRGRGQGRRTPPPDATGAEAEYLLRSKEAGTILTFTLVDGESITGRIEYYDRHMIKIDREGGPNLFVRKSRIRYILESD